MTAEEVRAAIREGRCNGCGKPPSEWGPVCGGMTTGDMTHYHSPSWWWALADSYRDPFDPKLDYPERYQDKPI